MRGELIARVYRALDARLEHQSDAPIALALSGGGDSMALLDLACAWAGTRGRRVLALTVDHGLSPDSAEWSRLAETAARTAGADWRGLTWTGPKPSNGLPAAAREARHRLLAEAAREAGARVILTGHTADDVAESRWMRARGSTLGTLRDWSPSPVWPEGRGLMLLRPLLGETRAALRDHLAARGLDWIEDPANADPRFGRSRARAALAATPDAGRPLALPPLRRGRLPLPLGEGVFQVERTAGGLALAATLVCAGGGQRTPRRDRVEAVRTRLAAGEDFDAALAGARLTARGDEVIVHRNPGEYARRPLPALALVAGVEALFDGRLGLTVAEAGWRAVPAAGRMAALSDTDRAALSALPAPARGAAPVLIRDGDPRPVLAARAATVVDRAARRLIMALDQTPHERDLMRATNGAGAWDGLSSFRTHSDRPPSRRPHTEAANESA